MDKIITATGRMFDTDMVAANPYPAYVYIRILGQTKELIESIFSNPIETARLVYGGMVFEGYTRLGYVRQEGNAWKVRLEKV